MAKAKEGTYSFETDCGVFDPVAVSLDKKEHEVLSALKNDLLKNGEFLAPKPGNVCYASICAWIIYCSSITEILSIENRSGFTH